MSRINKDIVAITPAMREGSGLVEFEKNFPDRYFDVGIAEQHALTFAAGLSCGNLKPIVAIYSTFLQRAYDQLIHDIAIQDLDILLAIDRAGIVGADGETHQGIYDISFLRILPNIVLMTPSNEEEMWKMLTTGLNFRGIGAVRYPRGFTEGLDLDLSNQELEIGKSKTIVKGEKIAYLVFGTLLNTVLRLAKKNGASVIDMRFVKPIDENIIISICKTHEYIFTVEDNVILGGAGSAVNEVVHKNNIRANIINLGVPDNIVSHGSQDEIFADLGLDVHGLENQTNDHIKKMVDLNNNRRNVKGK